MPITSSRTTSAVLWPNDRTSKNSQDENARRQREENEKAAKLKKDIEELAALRTEKEQWLLKENRLRSYESQGPLYQRNNDLGIDWSGADVMFYSMANGRVIDASGPNNVIWMKDFNGRKDPQIFRLQKQNGSGAATAVGDMWLITLPQKMRCLEITDDGAPLNVKHEVRDFRRGNKQYWLISSAERKGGVWRIQNLLSKKYLTTTENPDEKLDHLNLTCTLDSLSTGIQALRHEFGIFRVD